MMMHSWSFLKLQPGGDYFEYAGTAKADLFDRFLAALPQQVRVVTATQLSELVAQGAVAVADRMNTADVFRK